MSKISWKQGILLRFIETVYLVNKKYSALTFLGLVNYLAYVFYTRVNGA